MFRYGSGLYKNPDLISQKSVDLVSEIQHISHFKNMDQTSGYQLKKTSCGDIGKKSEMYFFCRIAIPGTLLAL